MVLVPMNDLLNNAKKNGYAVGYFESWNLESTQAVIDAAVETQSPVITGFGGYYGVSLDSIKFYAAIGKAAANKVDAPVSLLFNEAKSLDQIIEAIRRGFNAVFLDTSGLPLNERIEKTRKVVEIAHSVRVSVEAELGELPSAEKGVFEGKLDETMLTDPEEAASFVAKTGVDALAVSIGNIHLLHKEKAKIDLDRLNGIREAVDVPLVIHGGSGFPDHLVKETIRLGVCKFNVGTILVKSFVNGMKKATDIGMEQYKEAYVFLDAIYRSARSEMKNIVKKKMEQYGCIGRAREFEEGC